MVENIIVSISILSKLKNSNKIRSLLNTSGYHMPNKGYHPVQNSYAYKNIVVSHTLNDSLGSSTIGSLYISYYIVIYIFEHYYQRWYCQCCCVPAHMYSIKQVCDINKVSSAHLISHADTTIDRRLSDIYCVVTILPMCYNNNVREHTLTHIRIYFSA